MKKPKIEKWEQNDFVYNRQIYKYLKHAKTCRRIKLNMIRRFRRELNIELRNEIKILSYEN